MKKKLLFMGVLIGFYLLVNYSVRAQVIWGEKQMIREEISYISTNRSLVDLNNDGYLDILSFGGYGDDGDESAIRGVVWFANDGNNNFGDALMIMETGNTPPPISAADMDNDGDLDVLSLSDNYHIVWMANNGSGNFSVPHVIAQLPYYSVFYTADTDNDGDLDVLSGASNYSIALYENNGNGNFGAAQGISSTIGWDEIHIVDINNDGYLDLLTGSDNAVGWLKNNGDGSFPQEPEYLYSTWSSDPIFFNEFDLDSDGDIDVLVSMEGGIAWYKNDGNGNLVDEGVIGYANFGDIYTGDIDNDGDLDVIPSGGMYWYRNENDTIFNQEAIIDGGPYIYHIVLAVADIDNDGDIDILSDDAYYNSLVWYTNDGNGNFNQEGQVIETGSGGYDYVVVVDIDNDGDNDVSSNNSWHINDGNSNFDERRDIVEPPIGWIRTADVDDDGDNDILAFGRMNEIISWYENDGNGNFGEQQTIVHDSISLNNAYQVDIDNDMDMDILAVSTYTMGWFENNGGSNFGAKQIITTIEELDPTIGSTYPTDLDNDGDMDILLVMFFIYLGGVNEMVITWQMNDGNGNFTEQVIDTVNSYDVIYTWVVDLDSDGDLDIVANLEGINTESIIWYENEGMGTFATQQFITSITDYIHTFVDLDNDGDMDIMSYNLNEINWYENDGDGNFYFEQLITNTNDESSYLELSHVADVDNDGDNDILATFWNLSTAPTTTTTTVWYENNGYVSFADYQFITNNSNYTPPFCVTDLDVDQDNDILFIDNITHRRFWLKNLLNDPKVSGTVFYDLNQNGMMETGEYGLDFEDVAIDPDVSTVYTNNVGMFSYYYETAGDYTLNFSTPEGWTATTPTSINLSVEQGEMSANNNFGIYPDSLFTDVQPYITSGINRCSWQVAYYVTVVNEGTVVNPLTVVALQPDEQLTYTTALLAPDSIDAAGVIYWHINNLLPTQQRQLVVNFQVPNFSAMGDILNTQAVVNTYDDAGVLLSQNDFDYGAEVVCSYDPNDKQVTPIGIGAQNYTLINDDELVYTIRFQNTGNDTAFNIIITDTLSQYFDHSSFRLITSSHQMQAYRYPSGLVEFRFNHIMLPDSTTNEPRSHGFVQYAVKAVQPVPANTLITNTAYIYFDQNPAVVTNTIESLMVYQIPVGLPIGAMPKFHCYPNPTNTHLSIQQATNEPAFYTLYNAVGQLVATGTFSGVTHTFSVAHLPSGWYYLEVNGEHFNIIKE